MEFADTLLVGAAALFIIYRTTPSYRNDPNADPAEAAYDASEFEVTKKAITSPGYLTIDGANPPMYGASTHICGVTHAGYVPLTPRLSTLPSYATNDATTTNAHRNIFGRGEQNAYSTPMTHNTLQSLYSMQEDDPIFKPYKLFSHNDENDTGDQNGVE